jgi:hypothetical protein
MAGRGCQEKEKIEKMSELNARIVMSRRREIETTAPEK